MRKPCDVAQNHFSKTWKSVIIKKAKSPDFNRGVGQIMKKQLAVFLTWLMILCIPMTSFASGLDWTEGTYQQTTVSSTPVPPGEYRSGNILQPIAASLNQKMALRTGPGTNYTEWNTYPQNTSIVLYEQEMGGTVSWGMVEFHVDGGLIRAYTGMKRIRVSKNVPWANTIPTDALIAIDVTPRWGPGEAYIAHTKTLPAGTAIQVFHEESGYVMADFLFPGDKQPTRAWIPLMYLSNYQSTDYMVYVTYTPMPTQVPTPTPIPAASFITYDAGGNSTGFVDMRGTLWMMGYNEHGEIGTGSKGRNVTSPRQVLSNVADVQLGFNFSMALDNSGNVFAWGWNKYGQAGAGSKTQYVTSPSRVKIGSVAQLAAGDEHAVALISDGSLYTWGRNARGQLANGSTQNCYEPTSANAPGEVISVTAGDYNTAIILSDGTLWMAGDNSCGQLCQPKSDQPVTQFVQIPLTNVTAVTLGDYHAAALTEDGTLYVWGSNEYGQIGNWQIKDTSEPQKIMDNVRQVETGDYHTFALTHDGVLYAWGRNDNGQLGDGTKSHIFSPTNVLNDVWIVATGYAHTIAVKNDGTVWGVGRNKYGSLGLKNTGVLTRWSQMVPIPR